MGGWGWCLVATTADRGQSAANLVGGRSVRDRACRLKPLLTQCLGIHAAFNLLDISTRQTDISQQMITHIGCEPLADAGVPPVRGSPIAESTETATGATDHRFENRTRKDCCARSPFPRYIACAGLALTVRGLEDFCISLISIGQENGFNCFRTVLWWGSRMRFEVRRSASLACGLKNAAQMLLA
jgi:hypothetical protein